MDVEGCGHGLSEVQQQRKANENLSGMLVPWQD